MNKKRLVASLAAIAILLVVAGAIELALMLLDDRGMDAAAPETPLSSKVSAAFEEASRIASSVLAEDEEKAAQLVKTGDIIIDGASLERSMAERAVASAGAFASNVEHIDQRSVLSSGCEIVSLVVALQAEGFYADPREIADEHMSYGSDFSTDYVGSPCDYGGGLPPCVVDAGNSWLRSEHSSARVFDLTGTTFQGIADLVELGYPVLVWTTENMVEPAPSGVERNGLRWYDFEHCVVVCGLEGDDVLVADPLAGLVKRDREKFAHVYGGCGSMAAFVLP